jgi:hypothetical protein
MSHYAVTDDELQVVAARIGVEDFPTVLAVRPRHGTTDKLGAAWDRATQALMGRGLILNGAVAPELTSLVRALHRPDRELAMRLVTPEGITRISMARQGSTGVLATRVGDTITLLSRGAEVQEATQALLAKLPRMQPAPIDPVGAPLDAMTECLDDGSDGRRLADRMRSLGADGRSAMLLGSALSSRLAFGEIVYHVLTSEEDRISRSPAAVAVFYTRRGRIVAAPTRYPSGSRRTENEGLGMGFSNVVWESRSTAQLARDLTDGPGPASVGQAGAAWVRIADEFADVSADYDKMLERLKAAWQGEGSAAVARKLEVFGKWLRDMSLITATNGQRAEQAAVANTEAVMAMPTVSEALQAKDRQDMMASLAAYNGAILNGSFAELDEAARTHQANAAAVMRQYEDAVTALAQPWEQPLPDEASQGATSAPEQAATAGGGGAARAAGGGGAGVPPMPLAAWTAPDVKSTTDSKSLQRNGFSARQTGAGAVGGMGAGGYAPMAASRGGDSREYESTRPAGTLEGGGEPGAGLSDLGQSWQPSAQQGEFTVSGVSWGPNSALFDELVAPPDPELPGFAEEPDRTLEQFSNGWVSQPVLGADGEVRK